MRTTYMAKPNEVERKWYIVDAAGQTLGRLASEVASIIRGKHKPEFTPHVDTGDFVIVINASQIKLTGKKMQNKMYYRHSLYPGGLKVTSAQDLLNSKPDRMIEFAVHGMLPKNRLGDSMKTKLKVYGGAEHPHQAQQPEVWNLRG
ncbi:50S ribosomal protein L13 [Paenibacillus oryzisoli]|uniref:Large ribosomal subunit protein uL13 n=3 Tax=Paenibacillus TaxID=44249 RepID=A0A430J6W6_9BACL|nr:MULTISPECIES: 50S ribosomal protein L13 [Paenibacillus]MBD0384590.1 50S ribosomal protein L13 [Paenibacillus sedimenti]RTE04977.1 50S ribosomal protein L13 [Paenibacillus whitsoniae]